MTLKTEIDQDIWNWFDEFVTRPNEFYGNKFPPCPYARAALIAETVDVCIWNSGDVRLFIRENSEAMRDSPKLTTRVMVFPPRVQFTWGISEFVETLNTELIPDDIFLNTGVAKTSVSRYENSGGKPYFIVVANILDPVLKGAHSLKKSDYYEDWPKSHYDLVVERREKLAGRYKK